MRINAKYEIEKIINNQKTVSTEKLAEIFRSYEQHVTNQNKWYKNRITKLEQRLTNQRRMIRTYRKQLGIRD